jgi:hypothetical protein
MIVWVIPEIPLWIMNICFLLRPDTWTFDLPLSAFKLIIERINFKCHLRTQIPCKIKLNLMESPQENSHELSISIILLATITCMKVYNSKLGLMHVCKRLSKHDNKTSALRFLSFSFCFQITKNASRKLVLLIFPLDITKHKIVGLILRYVGA